MIEQLNQFPAELDPVQKPFVNEFTIDSEFLNSIDPDAQKPTAEYLPHIDESVLLANNLLSFNESVNLRGLLDQQPWVAVGVNGRLELGELSIDQIGSYRASCYSQQFADLLWKRLQTLMPEERFLNQESQTDWDGTAYWRPVGVSPLMRFIKYGPGGFLVPHYDAPYIYNQQKRTLMSVVLYIAKDQTVEGGATRFIVDSQKKLPVAERQLDDWPRIATDEEVSSSIEPAAGSALVFDHRILHDAEIVGGIGEKLLLRTDIEFVRAME